MTPTPKTIEAVARAKEAWIEISARVYAEREFGKACPVWEEDIARMRHCITAFLAAMKEEGYVMVPVEPTEAMRTAGSAAWHDHKGSSLATWLAMLGARPDGEG